MIAAQTAIALRMPRRTSLTARPAVPENEAISLDGIPHLMSGAAAGGSVRTAVVLIALPGERRKVGAPEDAHPNAFC
jgi:hypothetical protein